MSGGIECGVILAAGEGKRMHPLGARYPKPILPVCNKPIIQYQIEYMRRLGVRRIVVVVGRLGQEIIRVVGDGGELGVAIRYVEQPEPLGIAHALAQAEPEIDAPFLLVLGDSFFIEDPTAPSPVDIWRRTSASAVLVVQDGAAPEVVAKSFCVLPGSNGCVRAVIEKPSRPLSTGV